MLDTADASIKVGDVLKLTYQGADLAVMTVTEKYVPNKPQEAKMCYGTSSLEHPGVQMISMERGRFYLGACPAAAFSSGSKLEKAKCLPIERIEARKRHVSGSSRPSPQRGVSGGGVFSQPAPLREWLCPSVTSRARRPRRSARPCRRAMWCVRPQPPPLTPLV